jgi:hypothetical protein
MKADFRDSSFNLGGETSEVLMVFFSKFGYPSKFSPHLFRGNDRNK